MKDKILFLLIFIMPVLVYADPHLKEIQDRNLLNYIDILTSVKGSVEFNGIKKQDENQYYVISSEKDHFSGMVGVVFDVPKTDWFKHGYPLDIEFDIASWPTRGIVGLQIECLDANDNIIENIVLNENISENFLGTPLSHIKGIDDYRKTYSFSTVIPQKNLLDSKVKTKRIRLGVNFRNWKGAVRIYKLSFNEYILRKNIAQKWKTNNGNIILGGMHPVTRPMYLDAKTPISESLTDTGLKLLSTVGMKKVRYFARWYEIEKFKGEYDFDELDKMIDQIAYYQMSIGLGTVQGIPDWAADKSLANLSPEMAKKIKTHYWKPFYPVKDWADYENFVQRLLRHTKGKIDVWEILNEPNAHIWVGDPIKTYEQFLMRFYIIAKKIDPSCTVICGRVGAWLPYLLRDGMEKYMDSIASHPYYKQVVPELQKTMAMHNVFKPIFISEVGYGCGYPWKGPASYITEAERANAVLKNMKELGKISKEIYWYTPIQANRQYGLIQYEKDRYRPYPVFYAWGTLTGCLDVNESPVEVSVVTSNSIISKGTEQKIKLKAQNISNKDVRINFWPVGFVDNLGYSKISEIRKYDWSGVLLPGQSHEEVITIKATDIASGRYPVGLAVTNDFNKNNLKFVDIWVKEPSIEARVSCSENHIGDINSVNDLLIPVWSGDNEVPSIRWEPDSSNKHSNWIQYDFENEIEISSSEIYWYANPKPSYSFPKINYDTYSVPEKIEFQYDKNGKWESLHLEDNFCCEPNKLNRIEFKKIKTKAFRLNFISVEGKGVGISEWKVK